MGWLFLWAVIAFALSYALTSPIRLLVLRFGIVDRPNSRSCHQTPTPRAGGLAIVLTMGLVIPWLVPLDSQAIRVGLLIVIVAAVSLLDDLFSLSFKLRLAVQMAAAVATVTGLGLSIRALDLPGLVVALPHWLGMVLAVLFVVAYCNFFNFMDGINGLAAGQAVITAACLSTLLYRADCGSAALVAAVICGAAAGFAPHNFPAARIFMGDVGSVTLGFGLALLSLVVHSRGGVPWTTVLLVHAAFLFDATFTIGKRLWRGENITSPHREHNYQLLVRCGWTHVSTTLTVLMLSTGSCLAACFYAWFAAPIQWSVLAGTAAGLTAYAAIAHTGGRLPGSSRPSMTSPWRTSDRQIIATTSSGVHPAPLINPPVGLPPDDLLDRSAARVEPGLQLAPTQDSTAANVPGGQVDVPPDLHAALGRDLRTDALDHRRWSERCAVPDRL